MFTLMNHIIADRNKKDNTESLSVKIEFKDDSSEKLIQELMNRKYAIDKVSLVLNHSKLSKNTNFLKLILESLYMTHIQLTMGQDH